MPPSDLGTITYNESLSAPAVDGIISWVEEPLLDALHGLVYAKMGDQCLRRLVDFRSWPDGWSNGEGNAVAQPTLRNLQQFVQEAHWVTARPPSLFLTKSGGLEILVRTSLGRRLQVVLVPDGIEYFFEPTQEEGFAEATDINSVAAKFSRLALS